MIIILLSTPTILPFQKYKQIVKKILPSKREQVFLEWSFGLQFIKVDFVTGYQEIRIVFLETFWITKTFAFWSSYLDEKYNTNSVDKLFKMRG